MQFIAPKIHIVDRDATFGVALKGLLTLAGLASAYYASTAAFLTRANLAARSSCAKPASVVRLRQVITFGGNHRNPSRS